MYFGNHEALVVHQCATSLEQNLKSLVHSDGCFIKALFEGGFTGLSNDGAVGIESF